MLRPAAAMGTEEAKEATMTETNPMLTIDSVESPKTRCVFKECSVACEIAWDLRLVKV
jgi:hypothetical protein